MFVFPVHLLNPKTVEAVITRRVVSGGVSLAETEDVIESDGGGLWRITYGGIELNHQTRKLLKAWDGHLSGGATPCLAPLVSMVTANMPTTSFGNLIPSDLVSDDDIFPTFVRPSLPHIVATAGAGGMRATQLAITLVTGARLTGGEDFSIANRAYRVVRVLGDIAKITPPLREGVAEGAELCFEWPVVQSRLLPGQQIIPPSEFDGHGETSISFLECRDVA